MSKEPRLNASLLDATLAEVRKAARRKRPTPERPGWDQGTWRNECGTTMCFAGWAASLAGYRWANTLDPEADAILVLAKRGDPTAHGEPLARGRRVSFADEVATRRLGLTEKEADRLFYGAGDLRAVARVVAQIKAGELR